MSFDIEINKNHIEEIEKIVSLYMNIYSTQIVSEKLQEIISKNSEINKPHTFYWWLRQNYVYSIILQITKLLDSDRRSISLCNLLHNLIKDRYLSENQYLMTWKVNDPKPILKDEHIKMEFKQIVNRNGACCPIDMLITDVQELDKKFDKIRKYRNKILAHNDLKPEKYTDVTFNDIEESISFLGEMIKKYALLLKAKVVLLDNIIDFSMVDFEDIFKTEWIKDPL